jgi:hypothetical protein
MNYDPLKPQLVIYAMLGRVSESGPDTHQIAPGAIVNCFGPSCSVDR